MLIYLVTHSFLRTVTGLSFLGPGCGLCTGHSGPSSSSRRDPESQMASPTGLTPPTKLTSLRAPRGEKCLLNLGPGITLKAGDCRGLPGPLRSPQRVNSQRYTDAVINYFQKNFFKCARINSVSLCPLLGSPQAGSPDTTTTPGLAVWVFLNGRQGGCSQSSLFHRWSRVF